MIYDLSLRLLAIFGANLKQWRMANSSISDCAATMHCIVLLEKYHLEDTVCVISSYFQMAF